MLPRLNVSTSMPSALTVDMNWQSLPDDIRREIMEERKKGNFIECEFIDGADPGIRIRVPTEHNTQFKLDTKLWMNCT